MILSIGRRISLGLFPALLALVLTGWFNHRALDDIEAEARLVPQTIEVLQRLGDVSADLAEAESEARGFRLNRIESHYDAALHAAARIELDGAELRRLLAQAPAQLRQLEQLGTVLSQRADALKQTLDQARNVTSETDPRLKVLVERGIKLGAQARELIGVMKEDARRLAAQRRDEAEEVFRASGMSIIALTLLSFAIAGTAGLFAVRSITVPLERLRRGTERVAAGDYTERVDVEASHEIGQLASFFNAMTVNIAQREKAMADQHWIKASAARFTPLLQANQNVEVVCRAVVSEIANLLEAQHVVLYVRRNIGGNDRLLKCGGFAADEAPTEVGIGESLVGQCAIEARPLQLHDLPDDYVRLRSALGSTPPRELLLQPALFHEEVNGVLEVALLKPLSHAQVALMDNLGQQLGLALNALEARRQLEESLQTQTQLGDDLKRRQEELTQTNQELQAQADRIRASESSLREQQEELRQSNEEQQRANMELRQLTIELDEKARQLSEASGYKSQFLANMSHELRTPLNSLLILSKLLADNVEQTLTPKQIEYAKTIHGAGSDLLELINEVLDLAKIESGTVNVEYGDLDLHELARSAQQSFGPIAQDKGVGFRTELGPRLPESLHTDPRRVWQIVKNLLSNAFKFTDRGEVLLAVRELARDGKPWIALEVKDSGVGIAPERQAEIFEAFRQVESGPARKYGGTGLGLSISRKLADILGGELVVDSAPGQGSTFTLMLPRIDGAPLAPLPTPAEAATKAVTPPPFRPAIPPVRHVVAVVTEDMVQIVEELGQSCGLATTALLDPDGALSTCQRLPVAMMVLDATLGDGRAWVALGRLRQDPATRHIPIHVLAPAHERERAVILGASSFLAKPPSIEVLSSILRQHMQRLTRLHRKLLVVEDDAVQRKAVIELIGNGDVLTTGVATGSEAVAALEREPFDCVILDLGLPDMEGEQVLATLNRQYGVQCPPVLVYTGRPISRDQERRLMSVAEAVIIKGVCSPERLLHETAVLLNRRQSGLPKAKQQMIERARRDDPALSGRKILVVDDDVRNVFAITAALEDYGVTVLNADSGAAAIQALEVHPDTDLVLMDVMMPVMDGLEATRLLRARPQFADMPIFVITAKAMPGDREQCLAAGASDYLTKPLDMERLKAMARAWLAGIERR